MCYSTINNDVFPARFEEACQYGEDGEDFFTHLMEDADIVSEGLLNFPGYISKSQRAAMARSNPVAFVHENKRLLFDVLDILFGLKVENKGFYAKGEGPSRRKTRYYRAVSYTHLTLPTICSV